jgi:hypothetical protein
MFIKYYDTVMPLLLNILVNANDKVSIVLFSWWEPGVYHPSVRTEVP